MSNLFISVESVLSTHSMLAAIGCTSANEIAVSSNFIGKDIFGQLGCLFYMNKHGHDADKNPRRFIRNNIAIQQLATFVECATPLIEVAFLPIAAFANVGRNITFAGFGAINASIIQKLAIDNNIGEVYSKVAIVNTFASSLGMCIGLAIAAAVPSHTVRLFFVMPLVAVCRIVSYNKSVKDLCDR